MNPKFPHRVRVGSPPEFKRNLRQLAKKYRRIRSDIQPVIDALIASGLPGDRIQGIGFPIYKVRVRNSDAQRGKSGGYRIVFFLSTTTDLEMGFLKLQFPEERPSRSLQDKGSQAGAWEPARLFSESYF